MPEKNLPDKVEILNSSELSKLIMVNLKPLLKRIYQEIQWVEDKKSGVFKSKKQPKLSKEEIYNRDTFQYLANIIDAFNRLNYSQIFLARFPQPRKYEKLGITEDRWIYYHYSYFFTTLVSVYDTVLLLVSSVFDLGLNPKDCKNNTVLENNWVRNTKTHLAVETLDKLIKPYRSLRHRYVHRNETPKIDYLQFEEAMSNFQRWGEPWIEAKKMDQIYKLSRAIIVDDLENILTPILNAVLAVFDALLPEYKLRSSIHNKSEELGKAVNEIVNKT